MGILADHQIEKEVKITPFVKEQVSDGVISYGLTSYGYDARCGYKFKIFYNLNSSIVDPKNFNPNTFASVDLTPRGHDFIKTVKSMRHPIEWDCKCGLHIEQEKVARPGELPNDEPCPFHNRNTPDGILIPPNSFALAETIEEFVIPRDTLAVCIGKSTYARCGIIVNVTPLEPEWHGKVTVEISNTTPLPAKIYAGQGIMQINFYRGEEVCKVSYADRKGRYQDQPGLTLPFVKKGE